MDNQDKIFDKFAAAAQNSELKDFPGMEKVWSRVENKLDKKQDKKAISLWKKIAVAASLLLLISLGSQFLKSDKNTVIQTPKAVVNEIKKETLHNQIKNNAVVENDSKIISKTKAIRILDNQIKKQQHVVVNETKGYLNEVVVTSSNEVYLLAPAVKAKTEDSKDEDFTETDKENQSFDYSKTIERESAKVAFADKQELKTKKAAPLVVLNGNAISHSNDAKRDKMMQDELPNLNPENVESLVVLDEPLYIIDGVYYSENDLFGTPPTSPYAPLNKQEIKTITILQDLEATSKYGERGKKGVVIITTKTGKPASKN
ncbi:hypothetical protein [Flavobacterium pectinovorum]|uniref:hypothetical protein n=1 Tax=Flavobacterium pectinovorum TaxID=29533 RepID=UPI001FAB5901|nr:hypothetical protein [Flavobacterium pectinovorum]MCI9846320.1 hypothetical protein [Flavobacterium pectinovorum]